MQALSNEPAPACDFASIFRNSFHRETVAKMVCTACRQSALLKVRRTLADTPLPPVLVVNAGVRTSDELEVWVDGKQAGQSRFLSPRFAISKQGDGVSVTAMTASEHSPEGSVAYELRVSRDCIAWQSAAYRCRKYCRQWWRKSKRTTTRRTWSRLQKVSSSRVYLDEGEVTDR